MKINEIHELEVQLDVCRSVIKAAIAWDESIGLKREDKCMMKLFEEIDNYRQYIEG